MDVRDPRAPRRERLQRAAARERRRRRGRAADGAWRGRGARARARDRRRSRSTSASRASSSARGRRRTSRSTVATSRGSSSPELNDPRYGRFEGGGLEEYRSWASAATSRDEVPGGGESRWHIIDRYVRGFRQVLAARRRRVLVVIHSLPIAYVLAAHEGRAPGAARAARRARAPVSLLARRARRSRDAPRGLVRGANLVKLAVGLWLLRWAAQELVSYSGRHWQRPGPAAARVGTTARLDARTVRTAAMRRVRVMIAPRARRGVHPGRGAASLRAHPSRSSSPAAPTRRASGTCSASSATPSRRCT